MIVSNCTRSIKFASLSTAGCKQRLRSSPGPVHRSRRLRILRALAHAYIRHLHCARAYTRSHRRVHTCPRGESNLRVARSGGAAVAGSGTGPRRRVKKCEAARAAALSLSPSDGAAVEGGALGTTRGHQGSGERTASSQSAAEPARRTVGPRVLRSILRPFGSFASASRAPFAGRPRVFPFALSCLARLAPSDRIPLRDRVNAYTVRFAHIFFFSLCPRKRPTDRPTVRPFAGVRGESTGGFPRLGQETYERLPFSDFRWILSCGGIVLYEGGDDANLFCMVSTWNCFTLTGDLCSPVGRFTLANSKGQANEGLVLLVWDSVGW